jgi:hypothetical protein
VNLVLGLEKVENPWSGPSFKNLFFLLGRKLHNSFNICEEQVGMKWSVPNQSMTKPEKI